MVNSVQLTIRGDMGLKERQEREREAVSRAILDAARDLFVAEGYRNVSIRKIAERIEYSPAAIYGYFGGKDDIFFALAEEGFRLLSAASSDITPGPDVVDEVRQSFWRLYTFSRSHPEYFALMFLDRSVPRISRDWERFGFVHDMKRQVALRIQRAVDEGAFPAGMQPAAAFRVLMAAVHGAAVMCLCDRMAPDEDPDALARDTLEAALAGLRAGVPLSLHTGSCAEGSQQ
jgi:AcrR family transcriptional regulator